jgi:hypothetical protein
MAPTAFAFATLRSASSGVIPSALALDMQITVIIPMIPSASIQRNGLNPFLFAIIAEMIPRRILVIVTMALPLHALSLNKTTIILLKCKNRYETGVYVHESEPGFNRLFWAAHQGHLQLLAILPKVVNSDYSALDFWYLSDLQMLAFPINRGFIA